MWHFLQKTNQMERYLTTCSELVKNIQPWNVYQFPEILSLKLDFFETKTLVKKSSSKI